MFRHLLKMVWNRKRHNGLLLVEIAFTFLVLVVLGAAAADLGSKLTTPLGYSIDRVWAIAIDTGATTDDTWTVSQATITGQLLRETARLPGIEAATLALNMPYDLGARSSRINFPDQGPLSMEANEVSDDFADVLGIQLIAGRFFSPEDDAQTFRPVVIDQDLARALYGDRPAVGEPFGDHSRVVGVVSDYRRSELQARGNYLFERVRVGNVEDRPPRRILVRVEPGRGAAFEAELATHLRAVAPGWSFEIKPLERARQSNLRLHLAPLLVGGIIAGFLLLMVALGLTGVVWQSLAQRTREIGLRRAVGASATAVAGQLLGELLLLAGLALIVGTVLVLQVPLLLPAISYRILLPGLLLGLISILALTAAAGALPVRLASRLDPAEALRYD